MLVLAIDTSTKIGAFGLCSSDVGMIGEINLNCGNTHSETIMVGIDSLFKLTGVSPQEIDRIAVSVGPGSFTGIRIGVAAAKGLAYSMGKEIVGINELDIIAYIHGDVEEGGRVISMIDARKERVYYAIYEKISGKLVQVSEYLDGELKEFLLNELGKKTLFLGDGAVVYKDIIETIMGKDAIFYSKGLSMPRAAAACELALERTPDNLMLLEPFYISKTQAEQEKARNTNK